ncbi:MAG: SDR family NAD(P)-dependent oxidoreductase [Polyangiaceae bacterium]
MAGECIVVTGGAGSLGSALVRELCARDYRVAIVESEHGAQHANDLAKSLDGKAIVIISDVASTPAWGAALKEIERQLGPVKGAALIAGGWAGGKFLHEGGDDDTWHAMIESNIETAYRSVRALVPGMVVRKNGSIVVIGSRAVERPWTSTKAAAYAATKSAAVTLAQVVAEETRDFGVRVNAVLPSTIDTPANRKAMPNVDPSIWVKPESLAKVIAFLMSDDAADISGAVIPVYGRA